MALSKLNGTQLSKLMADMPKNMFTQKRKAGMITTLALNILVSVYTRNNWPQVVCLTQMEEKARQIGAAIEKISKYMDMEELKVIYAVRGNKPAKGLKVEHHIIIGTPGEVLDWYKKFLLFNITLINLFVLTEADIMIATQGYRDQCLRLHRMLSNTCQVILTSETINNSVREFANKIVSDPLIHVFFLMLPQRYNQESVPISFHVFCNQENFETLREIYRFFMIHCQMFRDQEINGWVLSSLTEEDLMQKMGIKLGPARKIHRSVVFVPFLNAHWGSTASSSLVLLCLFLFLVLYPSDCNA